MKQRLFKSVEKTLDTIVNVNRPITTYNTALDAIYASAIEGAHTAVKDIMASIKIIDDMYTMINALTTPWELTGLVDISLFTDTIKNIPTIIREHLLTDEQLKDELFQLMLKRVEINVYKCTKAFDTLMEFTRILGINLSNPNRTNSDDASTEETVVENATASEEPVKKITIPDGFVPIDFMENIPADRYCINDAGFVLDLIDLKRVEPIRVNGILSIPLMNAEGNLNTYTKNRLLWKAGLIPGKDDTDESTEEEPTQQEVHETQTTQTESKPKVMDLRDHYVPIQMTEFNIPENKYMINPKGVIWDRYAHRRLVASPDKKGRMIVELTGSIRPGNKRPTIIRIAINELLQKHFNLNGNGPTTDCARPDRISLNAITREVFERVTDDSTPVINPSSVTSEKSTESQKTESSDSEKQSARWIDFIQDIPPRKYKIFRDGKILNTYTDEYLSVTRQNPARYDGAPSVCLSASTSSAGVKTGYGRSLHRKAHMIKLMFVAFKGYDVSFLSARKKFVYEYIDGNINHYSIDNIRVIVNNN